MPDWLSAILFIKPYSPGASFSAVIADERYAIVLFRLESVELQHHGRVHHAACELDNKAKGVGLPDANGGPGAGSGILVLLPDWAKMAWVVSSRRRTNDDLIYPVLRSSESITDGELHDIVFEIDIRRRKGRLPGAGEGRLFIKICKAETIACADEQSCYGVDLYAAGEAIVKPIVIAQEFVRAGVAGAQLTTVGLGIQEVGCRRAQLYLEIFCDVEGHHLCEHKVVEVYGPVDGIILIVKSVFGIKKLGM